MKTKKPSIKQEWWRERYVVEGQLSGIIVNLKRILNIPALTEGEKQDIALALSYIDWQLFKSHREDSFDQWMRNKYPAHLQRTERNMR